MNKKLIRLWATKTQDDEWWSSFITSPIAIVINYTVVDTPWITPNLITLCSFITAISASLFIITGGTLNLIIAALLINGSFVLDCMDGQLARYRKTTSTVGNFFDKTTDQVQIGMWFGAVGYTAYIQSQSPLPLLLALAGICLYSLRGYSKYLAIYLEMSRDKEYLDKISQESSSSKRKQETQCWLECSVRANLKWFIKEQVKILDFNEGVLIFMLSLGLVINLLTPMLWIFALSQCVLCMLRICQQSAQLKSCHKIEIKK